MMFGIRLPVAAAIVAGLGAWSTTVGAAEINARLSTTGVAQPQGEVQMAQDAAAGLRAFIRCRACHTIGEGEPHRVGPNLFGIVGKTSGTVEGFENYSDALKAAAIVWDDDTLAQWLAAPADFVAGNKMKFPGANPADIPNLIAFMKDNGT